MILRSKPEYQIQMSQQSHYPFNGLKNSRYQVNVKLVIPFSSLRNNHEVVSRILSIENEHMIKPSKVIESYLHKTYTFIYEYVPFPYNSAEAGIQQYVKSSEFKADLLSLFKDMVANGVKPQIHLHNFGYSPEHRIKMFVKPDSAALMLYDNNDADQLTADLMEEYERLFQARDHKQEKWRIKVSGISEKLKKIQNEILCKDFRKKQVKLSESGVNSSENSDSLAQTGSNEKIGNSLWHFDHDFHFEDSYSVRDSKNKKKKRTSSFKASEKTKSEFKPKKASWEGSWKQEKSSAHQSDKITVLKKRISEALMKTQKTLTKYEKIRVKSSKKKYTQS